MTISPLTKKITTFLLSKSLFIVTNKFGGIVKVFDIILSIPFRSISAPANKLFNRAALTFFYCLLIKQTVYFKRFGNVGVTVDKYGGRNVRTKAMEKIIS